MLPICLNVTWKNNLGMYVTYHCNVDLLSAESTCNMMPRESVDNLPPSNLFQGCNGSDLHSGGDRFESMREHQMFCSKGCFVISYLLPSIQLRDTTLNFSTTVSYSFFPHSLFAAQLFGVVYSESLRQQ
jgi:hypothetical protein